MLVSGSIHTYALTLLLQGAYLADGFRDLCVELEELAALLADAHYLQWREQIWHEPRRQDWHALREKSWQSEPDCGHLDNRCPQLAVQTAQPEMGWCRFRLRPGIAACSSFGPGSVCPQSPLPHTVNCIVPALSLHCTHTVNCIVPALSHSHARRLAGTVLALQFLQLVCVFVNDLYFLDIRWLAAKNLTKSRVHNFNGLEGLRLLNLESVVSMKHDLMKQIEQVDHAGLMIDKGFWAAGQSTGFRPCHLWEPVCAC